MNPSNASLAETGNVLPASSPEVVALIEQIEKRVEAEEQIHPQMEHVLHAGMYARTCRLDAWVTIVSVRIKIPTMLIVNGGAHIFAGDRWYRIEGYQCMPASAGRKQIYVTYRPTEITMIFPSNARTVEEAEAEFTDEAHKLLSRRQDNGDIVIATGVRGCRE